MWYKIFMLIMLPALAIAWLAYFLYMRKVCEEEKKMPKQASTHLQKTRSEVADWAKKMAEYQPPKPPKSWQQGQDRQAGRDQSAS